MAIWKSAAASRKSTQSGLNPQPANGNTPTKGQPTIRQAGNTKEVVKAVPARAVLPNDVTGGDVDSLRSEFDIKFAIDLDAKDEGKILEIVKK